MWLRRTRARPALGVLPLCRTSYASHYSLHTWHPMTDSVELKLQPLHFGRVVWGTLPPSTKTFGGNTTSNTDMDAFVPKKLTRRQITSKHMGVFDIKGILIPLTARCKRDLRDVFKETATWDHAVSEGQRSKWVLNFLDIKQWTRMRTRRLEAAKLDLDDVVLYLKLWGLDPFIMLSWSCVIFHMAIVTNVISTFEYLKE